MSDMTGTRVWLVGASTGLGEGMVRELVARGCRVAITARRAQPLRDLAAACGDQVRAEPGDATDHARMAQIATDLRAQWGAIDVAIFNQGIYEPVRPEDFTADVVRRHVEVNVMGSVNGIEAVLGDMRARRAGRIVVVSSVTGLFSLPLASAYGATKAFLISMCDSLRADLAGSGVAVTVVAPGFIRTRLTENNTFGMPFIIDVPEAARTVVDGIATGDDMIVFPRRMAAVAALLGRLPAPVRRRVAAGVARRTRRSDASTR